MTEILGAPGFRSNYPSITGERFVIWGVAEESGRYTGSGEESPGNSR